MTATLDQNLTYVFIAGKNWKLSLAEILSYFKARTYKFKLIDISETFFLIETEVPLDPTVINELGGTIKIGRLLSSVPTNVVRDAFVRRNKQSRIEVSSRLFENHQVDKIFTVTSKKLVFGLSIYLGGSHFTRFSGEMHRFLGSKLKEALAARDIKSSFMGFPRQRRLPQLSHVEVLKKELIEKSAEILFCVGERQSIIARTVAVHNPFEFQKRDVGRPVQRKIFSIPPRLAKIMVNLASCLPGMILMDPFCGVGTILQEAMLNRARVIGVDIDSWCVEAARRNLEWIKSEYKLEHINAKVMVGDSRRISDYVGKEAVDCIVTEPDLGPVFRHVPTEGHAGAVVKRLMPLYDDFLESACEALKRNARLVFVTPCFRTRSGIFVSLSVDLKAASLGFKRLLVFEGVALAQEVILSKELRETVSFIDIAERQIVGREIHVLCKA